MVVNFAIPATHLDEQFFKLELFGPNISTMMYAHTGPAAQELNRWPWVNVALDNPFQSLRRPLLNVPVKTSYVNSCVVDILITLCKKISKYSNCYLFLSLNKVFNLTAVFKFNTFEFSLFTLFKKLLNYILESLLLSFLRKILLSSVFRHSSLYESLS